LVLGGLAGIGLILWVVATSVTSLQGPPCATNGAPVTVDYVRAHAEAQLTYPGAHRARQWVLAESCARSRYGSGENPASAYWELTTPDSRDAVFTWYTDQLRAEGWGEPQPPAPAIIATASRKWAKGSSETYELILILPSNLDSPSALPLPTRFQTNFQIKPRDNPAQNP
jgi:hypothetical protein